METTVKMNKQQQANHDLLKSMGGIVLSSQWVNGSGNYITAKAIPPTAKKIQSFEAKNYGKSVIDFFASHPRAKSAIAIV